MLSASQPELDRLGNTTLVSTLWRYSRFARFTTLHLSHVSGWQTASRSYCASTSKRSRCGHRHRPLGYGLWYISTGPRARRKLTDSAADAHPSAQVIGVDLSPSQQDLYVLVSYACVVLAPICT